MKNDHPKRLVKCVVWDLDNTLWSGVAAEGRPGAIPEPDPSVLRLIAELEKRGVVNSVASRNDPSMRGQLLSNPRLAGRFIAPQISWEPKSRSLRRIAQTLNIGLDALAFVDDSPFERAEVSYMLPQALVLSPEELAAAVNTPLFQPASGSEEAARRPEMYRQEERRREAETRFEGSRLDFLKWCDMHLRISEATEADLSRIHELTERTHQLNSTGRAYSAPELSERISDPRWLVPVARLADRFGDYGLIGTAMVNLAPGSVASESPTPGASWLIELVMLSCRVEGRGIPAALLAWVMKQAREAGAPSLAALYRLTERNLPMRLLFRQMGFVPTGKESPVGLTLALRDLSQPSPDYPEWLEVTAQG